MNSGRAEPAQLWLPAALTGVGALAIHLVRRTNKQHAELKRKTGELSITQQQLHSIQEDLQGAKGQLGSVSKELEHKDRELQQAQQLLQDTQGELGLTRSQLELLHRELHSEKRKLADTRSQLEVKDSALRQGQDFWEFSD